MASARIRVHPWAKRSLFAILATMDGLGVPSELLTRLAQTYGIRLMLLHGSVASAQEHRGSDVDIAVLFDDRNVGFSRMAELHLELQ